MTVPPVQQPQITNKESDEVYFSLKDHETMAKPIQQPPSKSKCWSCCSIKSVEPDSPLST